MSTKVLYTPMDGTPEQIVLADHATDFLPTAANDLRISTDGSDELDVQLTLASLASGSYRQSDKFDFGAHWAMEYFARLAVEIASTPTAGNTLLLYLAYSDSATAGTGNAAGVSGTDAAYTGYSSNAAASVLQAELVSVFTNTGQATTTVQVIDGWMFAPKARYASAILLNSSGAALHSDDVESHIVLNPVVQEIQDA
ncbi:hypothetical protein Pla52o_35210 [Novipirellula galeiformis]|uniref:Uncharacterized protein n=1 Tax=Novipirellula galeiformis TaxID=2528004 RepID=A0A5C6CEM1_9BACT|nr:hypothetical protein [Novipirellula galeiformis]TWU22465.1 hypothetical protein Pla52o_35210 [Novipirellula galeiformis]